MIRPRWFLLSALAALLLLAVCLVARSRHSTAELQPLSPQLLEELEKMALTHAELHEATAAEAIAWLNGLLHQKAGLLAWQVALWPETAPPAASTQSSPFIPGLNQTRTAPPRPVPPAERTVTFSVEETAKEPWFRSTNPRSGLPDSLSLAEVLSYVAALLGCRLAQDGHTIYLVDENIAFEPMQERKYPLALASIGPSGSLMSATAVRENLLSHGLSFPRGAQVRVSREHFFLRNTQENLDLCESIISDGGPYGEELTTLEKIRGWCSRAWPSLQRPRPGP